MGEETINVLEIGVEHLEEHRQKDFKTASSKKAKLEALNQLSGLSVAHPAYGKLDSAQLVVLYTEIDDVEFATVIRNTKDVPIIDRLNSFMGTFLRTTVKEAFNRYGLHNLHIIKDGGCSECDICTFCCDEEEDDDDDDGKRCIDILIVNEDHFRDQWVYEKYRRGEWHKGQIETEDFRYLDEDEEGDTVEEEFEEDFFEVMVFRPKNTRFPVPNVVFHNEVTDRGEWSTSDRDKLNRWLSSLERDHDVTFHNRREMDNYSKILIEEAQVEENPNNSMPQPARSKSLDHEKIKELKAQAFNNRNSKGEPSTFNKPDLPFLQPEPCKTCGSMVGCMCPRPCQHEYIEADHSMLIELGIHVHYFNTRHMVCIHCQDLITCKKEEREQFHATHTMVNSTY